MRRKKSPTGARVIITHVEPHGGDLVYVAGTIDAIVVHDYLPTETLMAWPEGERRRELAKYLLGRYRRAATAMPELTGIEKDVW